MGKEEQKGLGKSTGSNGEVERKYFMQTLTLW